MVKVQISIPTPYARLYPAWTREDHAFMAASYVETGSMLESFKALLREKGIDYSHLENIEYVAG